MLRPGKTPAFSRKSDAMKRLIYPDIYEYHDYRVYLGDVIDVLKKKRTSLRSLALVLETTASNLSMIIKGDRTMSAEICCNLAKFLGLSNAQKSYLESMVILMDDKNLDNKHNAYKKMKRHYKYRERHGDSLDSYQYLNDWINVAIREMAELEDFKFNFDYLRSKLPKKVSTSRIRKAMAFLKESNILNAKQDELPLMECVGGVYKLSLSKFHQEMMELTVDSIYEHDSSERMIMGHSVALNEEDFQEGVEIIEEAIQKLQKLGQKKRKNKNKVYHFTMAGIPLTK